MACSETNYQILCQTATRFILHVGLCSSQIQSLAETQEWCGKLTTSVPDAATGQSTTLHLLNMHVLPVTSLELLVKLPTWPQTSLSAVVLLRGAECTKQTADTKLD